MSEDRQSTESLPSPAEQSDSAGSAAANANNTNGVDGPPSPTRSKSRNAASAAKAAATEKSAEAKTVNAQSQPMTVTNSASSEMTSVTDAASNAAAPYSTRSRGRNGAPRPNYAEDVEMDFEMTIPAANTTTTTTTTKSTATSSKRSTAISSVNGSPSATAEHEKGPAASTRKNQSAAAVSANGNSGAHANAAAKDHIPGTSTFSANSPGNSTPSGSSSTTRKRKQPPSGATGSNPNGSAKRAHTSGLKHDIRLSSMMTFANSGARLKNGRLKADDGTFLEVNDHVYLICEPPGEPYYLGRIMEFLPAKGTASGPVEMVRVNWYYRPKDIQRRVPDPRLVFASMHSDPCPLSSLRGKCTIKHISEIQNLDDYRKLRDTFWYDKMFDRYMLRYYEVVPTKDVINVPSHVKRVLDERWKFVLCEPVRKRELTGAVKTCIKCGLYAANADSVDCAVCHHTYHMNCVRPKLTKKPARGFAWACALCSRAQERKLEARNTPLIGDKIPDVEEEIPEEEEDEHHNHPANGTERSSPAADDDKKPAPATAAQIAQAKMWPYRYYGIHCQLEDALDYDDRIYPRASSRIGTKHQAVVTPWYGKPVEYTKPADLKRKVKPTKATAGKLSKASLAAIEAEKQERLKRPWIMEEPVGFVHRGEDEPVTVNGKEVRTAEAIFKMPEPNQILGSRGGDDDEASEMSQEDREKFIDQYMEKAKDVAVERGLPKYHTNFLDKALEYLYAEKFNVDVALKRLKKADLYKDLKEPKLSKEQKALFAEGVSKYGSEWINIRRHIGNIEHRHVVRYYYMWKKTPEGRRIWNAYEGRHGKKEAKRADSSSKLLDDIADEADDSAFDNEKANEKKRGFQCKFCSTRSSPQWRRAPLTLPGATIPADSSSNKKADKAQLAVALCHRCALLWRKYAIEYKDADDLAKKLQASGNKAWRRKLDDELCAQALVEQETPNYTPEPPVAATSSAPSTVETAPEPVKKKARTLAEKDSASVSARNSVEPPPKKKAVEKSVEPKEIVPDPPRAKILPCAVCKKTDFTGERSVTCRDCRLTVHLGCYGVLPDNSRTKWLCDMCSNDRNPTVSTRYECVLCPVTLTEQELMETPKTSNQRKKSERDREKERQEKEMVMEAIRLYQQRQEAVGKPLQPREPLKRTAGNNWVHVNCAVWNPEIKFGRAEELEPAEGFGLIPRERYRESCKICRTTSGACVSCHFPNCNAKFHVGCALKAEYTFGFDVTPVKGSRKDSTVTLKMGGETGSVSPSIWCSHHVVQSVVHEMSESTDQDNLTALELYVRTYKQADLTMTETVRKAAHVQQQQHAQAASQSNGSTHRRVSLINNAGPTSASERRTSISSIADSTETQQPGNDSEPRGAQSAQKTCVSCKSKCSPRWWLVQSSASNHLSNGSNHSVNGAPHLMQPQTGWQTSSSHINGDFSGQGGRVYECHKCHIKRPTASLQTSTETHSASAFATPGPRNTLLPAPRQPEFASYNLHGNPISLPNVLASRPPPPPPQAAPPPAPAWYSKYEKRLGSRGGAHTNGFGSSQSPSFPSSHLAPLNGYASGSVSGSVSTTASLSGTPLPAPATPSHSHPYTSPVPGPSSLVGTPNTSHLPASGHYGSISSTLPPPPPPPPPSQPAHPYVGSGMGAPARLSPRAPPARPYGTSMSPPDLHASLHRSPPSHGMNTGPPRIFSVDRFGSSPSLAKPFSESQLPGTSDEHTSSQPANGGRYAGPGSGGMMNTGGSSGTSATNGSSGASASPSLKNLLS